MQQPPQYGYGPGQQGYPPQQGPGYGPPQGYGPPGHPPQGYQQGYQQGYPQQGYPPPKKKRTGLIIGIVVAVVLLGLGIPGGIFASDYFASTGADPISTPPPEVCKIPDEVLAKTGNTSLVTANTKDDTALHYKQIGCGWKPPADENVMDRTLSVLIAEYSGEGAAETAKNAFVPGSPKEHPIDVKGIGDRAVLVQIINDSAFSGAEVHVLQGNTTYMVELSGWDKGFFANEPIPQQEADDAVKAVATEISKRLPR